MQESRGLVDVLKDLQRRRVFRTVVVYAGVSWLAIQIGDTVFPAVRAPYWAITALVGLTIVGFPIVAILSWLFDVREGGIRRTRPGSVKGAAAIATGLTLLVAGTIAFTWIVIPGVERFEPPAGRMPNSIAVLAFDDYSPDQSASYLGEGVSEILIHQLAQVGELHVIARKSAFSFKGTDTDARVIGERLNVEMVLEGSVQKIDDQLRITAQLIDTETGTHLWSQLFQGSSDSIFRFQDEIADAVVLKILGDLKDESSSNSLLPEALALDSYELYLLGRQKFSEMSGDQAVPYFQQAIARNPDFALAHAGLGEALLLREGFESGGSRWDEYLTRSDDSIRAVETAERLAPDLAEVITARMLLEIAAGADHNTIRKLYQRATEASPNYVFAYIYFAGYLMMTIDDVGDYSLANDVENLALKARSLDPMNTGAAMILASIAQWRQQHDKAKSLAKEAFEFARTKRAGAAAAMALGQLTYLSGDLDQSVAYSQIALELAPDTSHIVSGNLGQYYLELQDYETSHYWFEQTADPDAYAMLGRGELYWATGDYDGLHDWTERLLERLPGYSEATPGDLLEDSSDGLAWFSRFYRAILGDCEHALTLRDRVDFSQHDLRNPYGYMIFATCLERRGDAESADAYRKKVNRMLNRFTAFDRYDGNWMHTLAEAYAFSGDDERAIELLEIASERGVRYIDVLERRFFFGDLVDDPRFVAVLDEMRKDVDRMRAEVAKASINDDWYSILLIEPKDWLK